jgi:hypothetical protein
MKKKTQRRLWAALAWTAGLLVAVVMALHIGLSAFLTKAAEKRTGFDFELGALRVNPLTGRLSVRGAEILNPSDFPIGRAVVIPSASVHIEPLTLFSTHVVIDRARLDVDRITLVQKADGETNLERLGASVGGRAAGTAGDGPGGRVTGPGEPAEAAAPRRVTVRDLEIAIGSVEAVRFDPESGEPVREIYEVNETYRFENLRSMEPVWRKIGAMIGIRAASEVLKSIAEDLELEPGTALQIEETVEEAAEHIGEALKQLFDDR